MTTSFAPLPHIIVRRHRISEHSTRVLPLSYSLHPHLIISLASCVYMNPVASPCLLPMPICFRRYLTVLIFFAYTSFLFPPSCLSGICIQRFILLSSRLLLVLTGNVTPSLPRMIMPISTPFYGR
jgi:uncharacterized membrane protein